MRIKNQPKPNWEIKLGDNELEETVVFNLFIKKPPNRFQRWMMKKCLGLHWRRIAEEALKDL